MRTYTFLLVNKIGSYLGWSKAKDKPVFIGDPNGLEWIEWGKELPDDIDEKAYKYKDGELILS